jgi:serine/threonine protein kinase
MQAVKEYLYIIFGSFYHPGEDIAVKIIPKTRFHKSLGSLRNEYNALKLSHKNVVRVLQVTVSEGEYGLVIMELCNGFNLLSLISDPTFIINSVRRTRYAPYKCS